MDLSIQLKAANGAICYSLFIVQQRGPLGTFFRYILRQRHHVARYDRFDRRPRQTDRCIESRCIDDGIEPAGSGIFCRHPTSDSEPNSSVAQVFAGLPNAAAA